MSMDRPQLLERLRSDGRFPDMLSVDGCVRLETRTPLIAASFYIYPHHVVMETAVDRKHPQVVSFSDMDKLLNLCADDGRAYLYVASGFPGVDCNGTNACVLATSFAEAEAAFRKAINESRYLPGIKDGVVLPIRRMALGEVAITNEGYLS